MKHTDQFGPVGRRSHALEEMRASTSRNRGAFSHLESEAETQWRDEQRRRRSAPPPPPPRKGRKLIAILSVVVALVVLAALGVALLKSHLFSQPGTTNAPIGTSTPAALPQASVYASAFGDALHGISMTSAGEGWAVGDNHGSPLILHYTGNQWERIINAIGGDFQASDTALSQVAMISATEGWAVGSYHDLNNNLFGLILHYTGGRWMPQMSLANANLSGLAMLSASNGWAIGANNYQQGILLHYTGGAWNTVPLAALSLDHIVMTSPTDGWIVGRSQGNNYVAWHYDGNTWTQVTIPGMGVLTQIAMDSASDGWVVGYKVTSGGARSALAADGSGAPGPTVFAHYDGKTWTDVLTFAQDTDTIVTSLSLDAPDDGWAVGTFTHPGSHILTHTLYLHYTGGWWKQVAGPDDVNADTLTVVMLSASDGWAVSDDGAILRYQQNTWKMVIAPGSK